MIASTSVAPTASTRRVIRYSDSAWPPLRAPSSSLMKRLKAPGRPAVAAWTSVSATNAM